MDIYCRIILIKFINMSWKKIIKGSDDMDFIIDSSTVQSLLLVVIFLSILVEIKTGGTGVGALLGLIAAAVFWGSSYVKGLVSLYQIAIFIVGVIFIIIEILTPTVGLLAGIGVVAIFYSLILAMGGDINAIYMMVISLVIAIIIFAIIIKKLPSSKLWKKIILTNTSSTEQGYVSSVDYSQYLNKEGIVLTELRPSGSVEIDGVPVDVVSEGKFISKGEKVRVVKIEGMRIIVRKVE